MKKVLKLIVLFVLLNVIPGYGQPYSKILSTAAENTPDSTIFQHCLDSISKYVYLDSRKIEPYTAVCEKLLINSTELSNRHRFEYVIQRIYNAYNYNNPLGILKIIENNKAMLDWDGILPEQKNRFNYLNGYTLLLLGELEDAQETFYELLDLANASKDTSLMMQSTGALGKLFGMQDDFVNAEKYSLVFLKIVPEDKPMHRAAFYIELIKLYLNSKQIDKADYYNKVGLKLADSLGLVDLQLDFLLNKVYISLEKGKSDVALNAYKGASEVAESIGNPNYQKLCTISYAEILEFQHRYGEALSLYDTLLKDSEKGDIAPTQLQTYYHSASKIADKKGDFQKAFQYIKKANQIADSLFVVEQKGKSQYLRIKFDAEEKEKENILLNARVLQKQSQNRFLYALIALFMIGILFLVAAFLQKRKYNRSLEREVRNRTSELEDANKSLQILNVELSEFTNILSHDLREPLRSIVGFSEMATKEVSTKTGIQKALLLEYLDYVNKSGKQLNKLIEDVAQYRSIKNPLPKELKLVDVNLVIDSIVKPLQNLLPDKKVVVISDDLPKVYSYAPLFSLLFKQLIENGIKFNENLNPTILIDYEQRDGLHVFLVKDNGVGIAPEFHDRVFGMFKRLHDRRDYEGSGLGLNIVKKIVHKLNGNISIVESQIDRGSTFQVNLPVLSPIEV